MAASTKRVVWDAAAWIALITDEKITDDSGSVTQDRGLLARTVLNVAERGLLEIVTPALALAEVSAKNGIREGGEDKVKAFFEHDYILVANVDTTIGNTARRLIMLPRPKSQPLLKPADAIYVSTAVENNIAEIHTFDGGLLNLSEVFKTRSGTPIVISVPKHDAGSAPLLKAIGA